MFEGVFDHSMILKAKKNDIVEIELINLRDFGLGPRKQVDDSPYGGGDGMVLMIEPLTLAIEHAKNEDITAKVALMTPKGTAFNQEQARGAASKKQGLILVCGRYEGYDERITELVDVEISIGNYVLTGGEIPAMTVVDSITRLIPGVLGGETSAEIESFTEGNTLEYPQYTRPEKFKDQSVPDILLSGNHQEIENWRQEQSKKRTKEIFG